MRESESVENYLKTIWDLESKGGRAVTGELARRLEVSPASVTGMLKRLSSRGLIKYRPYRGATLAAEGRRAALNVVRRHRLIEAFLVEVMQVPVERVHVEAERWEHVISDEMAERMDALLGRPATDPHGSAIPRIAISRDDDPETGAAS